MFPILFHIGKFEVHTYGAVMVVAFLSGLYWASRRAPRFGLKPESINDLGFWVLISGVLGARITFIVQELPYYLHHLHELFSLQFEGLTSFGGLIFGAGAIILWAKRRKVSLVSLFDLMAPPFLLGSAIGRVGCLMNGCCYGGIAPPNLPWGIHVAGSTQLHHPAQAYDTLMNLAALAIVLLMERRHWFSGKTFSLALVLHGIARIVYEFWRAGTAAQVASGAATSTYWGSLPFTQAQAAAGVVSLIGLVSYVWFARKSIPVSSVQPV